MQGLYLLSDAWGPKAGGINVFNTDFAIALGKTLGDRIRVGCIVLTAEDSDIAEAEAHQVKLLRIGKSPDHNTFDPARAHEIAKRLRNENLPVDQCAWIGNDIISGDIALQMRKAVKSPHIVLIHHMSYIDYQGYKHGVGVIAEEKHRRQRRLFEQADQIFGVGPMLRDRLGDMLSGGDLKPGMIVPGLPEVKPRPAPTTFTASTFGRLDPENDRIKQGRLAVAGFAEMVRHSSDPALRTLLERPPILRLIGIGKPGGDEEKELRTFAYQRANRAVNLHPLPYDEDRQRLLQDLAGSSVAMMLSWHEGFGLTGWEAIATDIPLILGKNSGLHQLIKEKLGGGGLGCLYPLNIHGGPGVAIDGQNDPVNFSDEDIYNVYRALTTILTNPTTARQDAARLKKNLLEEGCCTWQRAGIQFAAELGLDLGDPPDNPPKPSLEPGLARNAAKEKVADRNQESTGSSHNPTVLKKISVFNLRESGEISDEYSNLRLRDLYITRDCEAKIINALQDSNQPLFVTGSAGCGKTSFLWRVANRLLEQGSDLYFFRADYLVSDGGFQEFQNIPVATGAPSYVIIDTVDAIVGNSESRRRLETIFMDCLGKGYTVAAAIRPLEKSRYFTAEKGIPIPSEYSETEFSRVVESHVKAFYRLKDADTIAARVEEIKSIASGNKPVVQLAYQPLALRMLFSVYAPNEIPSEVNTISLYLEFWRKRVEMDWRAGRPEPEPDSKNLSKCAAWIAESMLMEGTIQISRDRINLAISLGRIAEEEVTELTSRGILHRATSESEQDSLEFFHQTFLEFAAAWGITAGTSGITLSALYTHLQENQFDSLRIPVLQNALALGQMTSQGESGDATKILKEILNQKPESLISPALFVLAQLPNLDSTLEDALNRALTDRKNATLFIRMTPSIPKQRIPAIWSIFHNLYEVEHRDKPERNPRAVRVAVIKELPRMVSRSPELTDDILAFLHNNAIIDDITTNEVSETSIELRSIATLLFETSRLQPRMSNELFLKACLNLCQRDQKHNKSLSGFIVTYCQSEHIPRDILHQVSNLLDGMLDAKISRVRAFVEARAWDEKNGTPYMEEHLRDITDISYVQILQSWSRGKSTSYWQDIWSTFVALSMTNQSNNVFISLWVRELWEKLDKHPLEPDGNLSFRAFEFLSDFLSKNLKSSDNANQIAAQKVCTYLRSQDVLTEIFYRIRNEFERVLTERKALEAFIPAMIRSSEEFDANGELFGSLLATKSARKKVIVAAVELIQERPELWQGLTDFLVEEGELHRLEVPIATGKIKAQPLSDTASKNLSKAVLESIMCDKDEERHRAARVAHMSLSNGMGLVVDYTTIRKAFDSEQNERIASWLAMCAMEVASATDELESAYKSLLSVCSIGDEYVRDRATSSLVCAIVHKPVPFNVDEFLDTIRSNINLRKLCASAQLIGEISHRNTSAAHQIGKFLLLDPAVNGIGKTVLGSFRRQSRVPMLLWVRHLPANALLDLIKQIPHLEPEIAMLLADISLHAGQQGVVDALQELIFAGTLDPELERNIGNLVRSRMVSIRPLRQVLAA